MCYVLAVIKRIKINKITTYCLLFLLSYLAVVAKTLAEQEAIRKTFELAEGYLLKGNKQRFDELYQDLHFYPLQPYLKQQSLIKTMSLSNEQEITEFLNNYQGSPLDWPLRKKWLEYLANKKQYHLYIKFYKPTNDTDLQCKFHLYQLKVGVSQQLILPLVTELWQVGKSQPKACDPLFELWQKHGYQTDEVVWQRIIAAADGGKSTLLPYLIKQLPASLRAKGELWRSVRVNPSYVAKLTRFPAKDEKETEMVTYALKRYIWRDPDHAIKVFEQAQTLFPFNAQQIKSVTEAFAISLASKGHKSAKDWLVKLDDSQYNDNLIQWRITEVLRDENWSEIKQELLSFPKAQQENYQWRYWYGRSLLKTNEAEKGQKVLAELSNERHYYGFLAAGYLNKTVNLQHTPVDVSEQEKYEVLKHPAGKRAFEFYHLGRYLQARSEWNYWLTLLNDREKVVAAKIAHDKGWFDRGIFTLANVGYLNDVDLRFPMGFEQEITQHAKKNNINLAWVFAITRRESSFMTDAHSPVGASGLLQLMPDTAKLVAKKKVSAGQLYQAEDNIELGTKYLQQLSSRFNGNQILASASYNAGPMRIKAWLKDRPKLPVDIWIETIPYKETREYVKSVMAYQQIYLLKTGQNIRLFDQLSKKTISEL